MKGYFRKRGSKWSFSIDVGRDPVTGKRKQKTVSGFKTKKEAEKACAELIAQIENGEYVEASKNTVKEFILQWMENSAKRVLRASTYDIHVRVINRHIIPDLGNLTMDKITAFDIQTFYNKKLEEGFSPDYVRYMHAILSKVFKQAVKWGVLPKNIMEAVEPPRPDSKEIETWGIEDATQFLTHTEGHPLHIAYVLAIYTGMRKGEILGLRWKDCDLPGGKISIRQTLYRTGEGLIFQEPKTKSSKRMISLPDVVVNALKQHKAEQNKWKLALGPAYQDFDLVVTTAEGKPVDPRNVTRHFNRMVKEAGVPVIRFHDMRHTHATIMLQLGEHPKVVSERLGHSRIAVTMDTYSHVLPDLQKEAADKFAAALQARKAKAKV